jgi:hypothetical protein
MSHVVVILPAAGEIITTSKDFEKYVFLHFPTGPVASGEGWLGLGEFGVRDKYIYKCNRYLEVNFNWQRSTSYARF